MKLQEFIDYYFNDIIWFFQTENGFFLEYPNEMSIANQFNNINYEVFSIYKLDNGELFINLDEIEKEHPKKVGFVIKKIKN